MKPRALFIITTCLAALVGLTGCGVAEQPLPRPTSTWSPTPQATRPSAPPLPSDPEEERLQQTYFDAWMGLTGTPGGAQEYFAYFCATDSKNAQRWAASRLTGRNIGEGELMEAMRAVCSRDE